MRRMSVWFYCLFAMCFSAVSVLAQEDAGTPATEVVIVATQHFISDMPEGYTPGHLRALLKKLAPDVLAVEAPSNVPDPWQFAPLDLWQTTKPWADQEKIALVPCGWNEPQYGAQIGQMIQSFQNAGKFMEYQKVEQEFQTRSAAMGSSCEVMNSDAMQSLWRSYHAGLHQLNGKDTPWEEWNKKIVGNVIDLCRQYKGKRVVVVFGGAHTYYLQDVLAQTDGVKVVPVTQFFPLTGEEIQANTYPEDYLRSLRLLNFAIGSIPFPAMKNLEASLAKVKESPKLENDYHLFYGKYLLHSYKPDEALKEFQMVAALDASVVSAWDNQTRLRENGLLYAGIAKIQMQKFAEAREDLQAILSAPEVSPGIKQFARQLLNDLGQQ